MKWAAEKNLLNVICVASFCRSPALGYQHGCTSIEMVKHAGNKQQEISKEILLMHSKRQFLVNPVILVSKLSQIHFVKLTD
jgi:hypothetical protein